MEYVEKRFKFYALWMCAFIILVFIMQTLISGFTEFFVLDSAKIFEFWRFFTSIFLHAGLAHLVLNLFALALFGSILERFIGGKRFLLVFFVSGIIANLISVNFYSSSLGASGAIFGVIGALVLIRPLMTVWAFGLPMPLFVAGIIWIAGDLMGAYGFLTGNPIDNTGNIAHLSGILIGILFGAFYRRFFKRERRTTEGVRIPESYMRDWEDYYLK